MKNIAKILKAIHAEESREAARKKAKQVAEELRNMKLKEVAKKHEDGIEETLAYMNFPYEHWNRIRTNNAIVVHFLMGSQLLCWNMHGFAV